VEGKEEQLVGLLPKKYGYAKEKAEEEYKGFIGRYRKHPSGEKVMLLRQSRRLLIYEPLKAD
jgi:hypothetical protein